MLIPFIFSFHPKLLFYKNWKAFFPANFIIATVFIIWDVLFTRLGIWGFNHRYLCGLYLFGLPLEELLFFFCIPYACLFTYHALKQAGVASSFPTRLFSVLMITGLMITGIANHDKHYTFITFLALSIIILVVTFIKEQKWLARFYLTFLLILIPFFIVNGLLTGSMLEEPVVWYNNEENLGIRLFTIPVEDVFYGMLLLTLNTWVYEYFLRRQSH